MSHSNKGAKHPGTEMWGKRGGRGEPVANGAEGWNPGATAKKTGIKTERARLKQALRAAVRHQVQEQADADFDARMLREYGYPDVQKLVRADIDRAMQPVADAIDKAIVEGLTTKR